MPRGSSATEVAGFAQDFMRKYSYILCNLTRRGKHDDNLI